ncbi:hypothetical protein PR202_ga10166 [Eleusine coracana subsp. coracana]|uniref:F-box domain-containing protein n=1 Tax=Eleusine coracana subsp. coracana TaxID=191504 RepID=A0AAV5C602_ELECO|nr:hypothetical protein PR202_ga10166 [Eleusine coracana subsp. coracana]
MNDEAGICGLSGWKKRVYLAALARGLVPALSPTSDSSAASPRLLRTPEADKHSIQSNAVLRRRKREKIKKERPERPSGEAVQWWGMPRQAAAAAEAVMEVEEDGEPEDQEERWARLLPELLSEVVRRVEASGCERWPARKDVVSCACVCRRWRDVTAVAVAVVRPPAESGKITFPSSLKQVRTDAAVWAR